MVTCTECERRIEKLPRWLSSANVKFVCEDCRQKHPHQWTSTDLVEPVTEEAQGETEAEEMEVPFSQVEKELLKQEGEEDEESEYNFGFDDTEEEVEE